MSDCAYTCAGMPLRLGTQCSATPLDPACTRTASHDEALDADVASDESSCADCAEEEALIGEVGDGVGQCMTLPSDVPMKSLWVEASVPDTMERAWPVRREMV